MSNIENMIYEIRGEYVMLDSDLAKIYQVETKRINEAVRRNKDKFPDRYTFILTNEESKKLLVAKCDQKIETRGGKYNKPRVFTEQGVWMLSTILKTKIAIEVNIKIIDAFVHMRKYISSNLIEQKYINDLVLKDNERLTILENTFDEFKEKRKINEIYFKGQIYDAYSKIVDIMKEAKKEIIVIDSFLDKSILDMIRNVDVNVTLITSDKSKLKEIDIEKYNEEYSNLKVLCDNTFHDRYIIIDKEKVYHLGASINHAGSKTFSINILEDEVVKHSLIERIDVIYEH